MKHYYLVFIKYKHILWIGNRLTLDTLKQFSVFHLVSEKVVNTIPFFSTNIYEYTLDNINHKIKKNKTLKVNRV